MTRPKKLLKDLPIRVEIVGDDLINFEIVIEGVSRELTELFCPGTPAEVTESDDPVSDDGEEVE